MEIFGTYRHLNYSIKFGSGKLSIELGRSSIDVNKNTLLAIIYQGNGSINEVKINDQVVYSRRLGINRIYEYDLIEIKSIPPFKTVRINNANNLGGLELRLVVESIPVRLSLKEKLEFYISKAKVIKYTFGTEGQHS